MPDSNELVKKIDLKYYYNKQEVGFRLPPEVKLDAFWKRLVQARHARAEFLPFKDQHGQPFWFVLTPELQRILHEIDSCGKDSLYRVVQKEIQTELIEQALIEEALFSSVIEGAVSTLKRARELIAGGDKPRDISDQMVMNNARVMRYVLEKKDEPCSLDLMHEIQKIVVEKTMEDALGVGRFRNDAVYIVNVQGEVVYTAPPASAVQASMKALADWVNQETRPFMHPIICAIVIHTYFVYVHPYFDGNGRTARSLFYWYLLKHGYDFFRYFSISSIIQETRGRYYKALKDMEEYDADMTYVLLYMAESVECAIDVVVQRIKERYQRELIFSAIEERNILLNERQKKFLKHLMVSKEKRGTIAEYERDFKVVFETARRDLAELEKLGILKKQKAGRRFVYTLNLAFVMRE